MPSESFKSIHDSLKTLAREELEFLKLSLDLLLAQPADGAGASAMLSLPSPEELAKSANNCLRNPNSAQLTGPEIALLACTILRQDHLFGGEDAEQFESRRVSGVLNRSGRSVSNITSTMESLLDRALVELSADVDRKGTHKVYRLTQKGVLEAARIIKSPEFKDAAGVA